MKVKVYLIALCLSFSGLASAQTPVSTATIANPAYVPLAYNQRPSQSASNPGLTTGPAGKPLNSRSYGKSSTQANNSWDVYRTTAVKRTKDITYEDFVFGIYLGTNSTRFAGDELNVGGDLSSRVGYQAGFFARTGGRVYGQLGAEYFASSSNYYIKSYDAGQPVQDRISIQYIQIPAYIGYKLVESDRGVSAVRLQAGVEYANRVNATSGKFQLSNAQIKSGTVNALGQLGFDLGPLLIDLTYHYGFGSAIQETKSPGFAGAQRRVLSASIGVKL
ncbi:outer membrane beta-barrel protein [Spirosoma sp. KUDC1026]|uniref:outer membrane beta-barrel protein n=1 Tax=Spirosoma sp. KUDC1026 TaxID=2745947 RepID=UPI00159BAAF7|nr:outer membrane beta-barrel protein [Spirosoma sp. KUDC1026]QKZ14374.1 outer membrane beta-barrel protein [Spirosoma sp. KUDC1026]